MRKSLYAILTIFATLLVAMPLSAETNGLLSAQEISNLVPGITKAEIDTLMLNHGVSRNYDKQVTTDLAPKFPGISAIRSQIEALQPDLGMEVLYEARIPPALRQSPDFARIIYNMMRSVSSLKGIEYFSHSRNRMRVFYEDAYAIDNPEAQKRIPDPIVSTIPASDTVYSWLKDSSFGTYVMRANYVHERWTPPISTDGRGEDANVFKVTLVNMTPLHYSILPFPIIASNEFQINLVALPIGNTMVFYANSGVKAFTGFGLKNKITESFLARIDALYNWFQNKVDEAAGS